MTNKEVALLLDPERKRAGWWIPVCPTCGRVAVTNNIRCVQCNLKLGAYVTEHHYHGPPLATDDLAAFAHLRPVVLACGYVTISEQKEGAWVEYAADPLQDEPWLTYHHIAPSDDYGEPLPYAPALAAAIAWLHTNEPERLAKAIKEVSDAK